ncbi:MAG: DUF6473 family protein [Xenococcaceae cyanobacterium MO_188.B29]|nr:DUF6473 family protein [Xenococcaceae cyanobacterium MO_188.B29]
MGKFYQTEDINLIDYEIYNFEGLELRGPESNYTKYPRYISYIGAAQTFGRYCQQPFPNLIGSKLNIGTLNFGRGGAGPTYFLNQPTILEYVNRSELVVVQVMSARSISNSVFKSLLGGNMGLKLPNHKKMRAERVFKQLFNGKDPRGKDYEFVFNLIKETRQNYLNATLELLQAITVPKVLFWFSVRTPEQCAELSWWDFVMMRASNQSDFINKVCRKIPIFHDYANPPVGIFPHFVNREMFEVMKSSSDFAVECSSSVGLPQIMCDSEGKAIRKNDYYASPEMQQQAAELLIPVCQKILETK